MSEQRIAHPRTPKDPQSPQDDRRPGYPGHELRRGAGTAPERHTLASRLSDSPLAGIMDGNYEPVAVLPEVRVVKLGGQSILDRGRKAVFPVLDELISARAAGVPLLVLTGGGTRARHIYALASELALPTGVLAALGSYIPLQNARMVQMLLAKHGGVLISADDFEKLPVYLRLGCIPVMSGMPPFSYWEKRPRDSRIPEHRTDAGVFLSAEFLGARRAIFIKDEDGLYAADPKKERHAEQIPRISAAALLARNLPDLVVERVCVEYLLRSRFVRELQIVSGLVPGEVSRALRGEDVGTIIYREEAGHEAQ